MPPESSLSAVPVRLDLANERLWCGDQARALRPKTFALLCYLVEHPGQLLTKAALLEALWPETTVSEVVLSVCIRELRRALGDDARMPRFIETVHRRGYRFIGHLPTVHLSAPPTPSPPLRTFPPLLPGREMELDALQRGLATALTGARQLLFVTGEAGLGETTLVDVFLTTAERHGPLRVGRGQCSTTTGQGKPICRSWRPWSDCVGDREARTSWRSCGTRRPPGWCRCPAWSVLRSWRDCSVGCWAPHRSACCGRWRRLSTS